MLKPAATAAVLVRPDCHTPVSRIVIALIVEVTNETMNTSIDGVEALLRRLRALRAVP